MRSEARLAVGVPVRPEDEVFQAEATALVKKEYEPAPALRSSRQQSRALTEENISLIAAMEGIRERAEQAMMAGLKEALDELGPLVSAEYLRIVEEEGLRQAPDDTDLAEIERIVDKVMSGWVGWAGDWEKSRWDKSWDEGLEATALWMRDGLAVQLDITLGAPDPLLREVLASGGTRRGLTDIKASTRSKLFRVLSNEPVVGMHPSQAAKEIARQVPAGPWKSSEIRGESSPALRLTSPRTRLPWTPTAREALPTSSP